MDHSCAYVAVQVHLVPEDARADPSGRWVLVRTYQVRLEAAYRPVPSCRPDPSDEVLQGDAANRPCGVQDDEDGARVRHLPCAGEACAAIRSSCHEVASDEDSATHRSDEAPRLRRAESAVRRASALSPAAAAADLGARSGPYPRAAAAGRLPCC